MSKITFAVSQLGTVEMQGVGPWRVRLCTRDSFDIIDGSGQVANPTVTIGLKTGGSKRNQNVVFANQATAEALVSEANKILDATVS